MRCTIRKEGRNLVHWRFVLTRRVHVCVCVCVWVWQRVLGPALGVATAVTFVSVGLLAVGVSQALGIRSRADLDARVLQLKEWAPVRSVNAYTEQCTNTCVCIPRTSMPCHACALRVCVRAHGAAETEGVHGVARSARERRASCCREGIG